MQSIFRRHAVTILLFLLPLPLPAGGLPVYDVGVHMQTILTAKQTAQMEIQQIRDYVIQIKKMEAAIKNAQNLPGEVLEEIKREIDYDIRVLTDYEGAVSDSYGSLNDLGNFVDNLYRRQAASDLTAEQWLERERELAAQGNASAKATMAAAKNLTERSRKDMERRKELQKGIKNEGLNESIQKTNQYMDMVASQNANLGNLLTAQALSNAAKGTKESGDRKRDAELKARAEKGMREQDDAVAAKLRQRKMPTFGF